MNIIGAIVAGLAGTAVMSMIMAVAPRMGMPKMAIWELMGSMFDPQGNRTLGWVAHLMMGVIFAVLYAGLWSVGVGSPSLAGGALFGLAHWLIVGLMMGGVPLMHAGIGAGRVIAPGFYMVNTGGLLATMGGAVGHIVYGIVVALVYSAAIG